MVTFESLGTVSYSPSIVIMAVSVAVCEIFSVKEWRDLENQVRGRSGSLKMAPLDRQYATFCSAAIANIALSCRLVPFKSYLTLNNTVNLKSWLEVTRSLKLMPFNSMGAVSNVSTVFCCSSRFPMTTTINSHSMLFF